MTPLEVTSHAKLNLGLEVLRRRGDGYHEIATILHEVAVHDRFVWTPTGAPFEYASPPVLDPDHDLVIRALNQAPDREEWTGRLTLEKRIPLAAGLGGGSSNAALALRLAFPGAIDDALRMRAAELGSDIPFFLSGGTALATGTGTTLAPLPSPRLWFVVVTPSVAIQAKTSNMYAALEPGDFTDGSAIGAIADEIRRGESLPPRMPSAFLRSASELPAVERARTAMLDALGQCALTGAGPSLYAMFSTESDAEDAFGRLPGAIGQIVLTHSRGVREERQVAELAAALRGTIHG